MYRVKKLFGTLFPCNIQESNQFSGELICSNPTLVTQGNAWFSSPATPPAPNSNAIQLEDKENENKEFPDPIFSPIHGVTESTDEIPSSENPPVDIATNDHQKHAEISTNDESEECEAPSFRQFMIKKEAGKLHQEAAQALQQIPEDEGFSFWPKEESDKQDSDINRENDHVSENQERKVEADQIPAEQIVAGILKNQAKMRLSFNSRSTNRSILMDPTVAFSAGFSSASSSSSSSRSIHKPKKKLRFKTEECCIPNRIRKAEILFSKLRLKTRIYKVASGWDDQCSTRKTLFCSSMKPK